MMRLFDAPRALAASTYSFSRRERNCPRTVRLIGAHSSAAMIKAMKTQLPALDDA